MKREEDRRANIGHSSIIIKTGWRFRWIPESEREQLPWRGHNAAGFWGGYDNGIASSACVQIVYHLGRNGIFHCSLKIGCLHLQHLTPKLGKVWAINPQKPQTLNRTACCGIVGNVAIETTCHEESKFVSMFPIQCTVVSRPCTLGSCSRRWTNNYSRYCCRWNNPGTGNATTPPIARLHMLHVLACSSN